MKAGAKNRMVDILHALVSVLFSVWILGTVAVTVNTWGEEDHIPDSLRNFSFFTPNWNFFAPHPGQWDYHLLYRDRLADGSVTAWTETTELTNTRDRYKWVWNPNLYRNKGLFDMGQELAKEIVDVEEFEQEIPDSDDDEEPQSPDQMETIQSKNHILSTQYLLILNYVSARSHHEEARETQFMLMRSSLREGEPDPLFISNFHKL